MSLIAVYGTLKKDNHNHFIIESSRFIGHGYITGYDMYAIGVMKYGRGYPYIVPSDSTEHIEVEIYDVDEDTQMAIDYLETGYKKIETDIESNGVIYKCNLYIAPCKNYRFDCSKKIPCWDGRQ